jgi:hypothetical protein
MKNFTFFLVFFLAAFLSLETMAQKKVRGGRSILPIYSSIPSSGLQLWLEADEGVTLNGSTVSQWTDQSGNGNNSVQIATDCASFNPYLLYNQSENYQIRWSYE